MKHLILFIFCCAFLFFAWLNNEHVYAWSHNEHFHNNTGQTAYDVHKILDGRYAITAMMTGQPFNSTNWYWRGNETVLRWYDGQVPNCQRGHCCFTAKPRIVYIPVRAIIKKKYWTDRYGAYIGDCGPNISIIVTPYEWGVFNIEVGNFSFSGELDNYLEHTPPFFADQMAIAFTERQLPLEELTVENIFEGGVQLDWQDVMTPAMQIEPDSGWILVDSQRPIPQVDHGIMLFRAVLHEADNLTHEVFQFEIRNAVFTPWIWNNPYLHNNTGQTAYDVHMILDGEYYIAGMRRNKPFPYTTWYHRKDETVLIWKGAPVPHCTIATCCFRSYKKKQIKAKIKKAYWTDKEGTYIGDYGPTSSVKLELKKNNRMELAVGNYRYLGREFEYLRPAPAFAASQIDVAFTHRYIPMVSLIYDSIFVANPFNLKWIPQHTLAADTLRHWNHLRLIEEYNNEPYAVVRVAVQEGGEIYHDMFFFELEGLEPLQPSADFYDDGYVEARDLQEFGDHWHLTSEDSLWNRQYNLDNPEPSHWGETEPVQEIEARDLQIFGDRWHTGVPLRNVHNSKLFSLKVGSSSLEQGICFDLDAATMGNQNVTVVPDPNDYVRVDVYAICTKNLDTYEFEILYDKSQFEYTSAIATNPFNPGEKNFLETSGGTAVGWMVDSSTPGVLSIAYTLTGNDPAQAPDGGGLLASVVFKLLVKGVKKQLEFGDVKYYDSYGVLDKNICKCTATVPVEMIASAGEIPEIFDLAQSYPNPFNAQCIIKYQLPKNCFVTLKIYNIHGQEVATLVRSDKKAGYYSVTWNGRDKNSAIAANGIYFYILETDGFKMTKKMTLLK